MDRLRNMTVGYNASLCNGKGYNSTLAESFQITSLMYIVPELVLILFISFGNILVLLAVRKFPELQTSTNIYVVSLSIADLSVGLFVLPLHVIINIFPALKSEFFVCMLRYCVLVAATSVSGMTLVILSIDKYIAIEKPYSYITIMTNMRSKIVCAGVWIFMVTYAALPMVGWNQWSSCSECTFSTVLPAGYITSFVVATIIAVVIIGVLNAKIFITANAISRDIKKQEASVTGRNNGRNNKNLFLENKKAAKVLFMVFGIFGVCTLPFALFTLWENNTLDKESRERYNLIRNATAFLGMLNSGINPIIYHRRIPQFNAAFRKILRINAQIEHTMN